LEERRARSLLHLARIRVLADEAGLIADPDRAVLRMTPVLEIAGIHI